MIRTRLIGSGPFLHLEAQRAKYKHWFPLGMHRETDRALAEAVVKGEPVAWPQQLTIPDSLFNK